MSGRGPRVAALVACAVLAAGGCGAPDNGDGGGEVRSMRLQVSGEREEVALFETLARAYEEEHPGARITVDVVPDEEEHLGKLATSFAAGRPPEAFVVNYRHYATFVTRGAVVPVEGRVEPRGLRLDGWPEAPLAAFRQEGTLQCLPLNASSMVVYVNRSLFAAAGVALPERGWTWEDLRATARALTDAGVQGIGIQPNLIRLAPFVWSAGGELVDDPDRPTRLTLDTPPGRAALGFLVGLVQDDGVATTVVEAAASPVEERFAAGRLGMVVSSRRATPRFREVSDLDFDVVEPPVAPGGEAVTVLHTDGICLGRGSSNLDLATDFTAYAGTAHAQQLGALSGRIVPVAPGAKAAFLDPTQRPANGRVFLDQLPVARALPAIAGWSEVEDLAADVLRRAFAGELSVEAAVRELDRASVRPLAGAGEG